MFTTESRRLGGERGGFTLIEVLLGLTLTVVLALALMPLALCLERQSAQESDRTITVLQGRVAAARLERDLRLASAGRSVFVTYSAILEATPSQVVFLGQADDEVSLDLIEWECAGGRLMRRWGRCPDERPPVFGHGLFLDSKTMLEGLREGEPLSYVVMGRITPGPVPPEDLGDIEAVRIRLEGEDDAGRWSECMSTVARVGR